MASGETAGQRREDDGSGLAVKTVAELRAKPLNELTGLSAGRAHLRRLYRFRKTSSQTFMNGKQTRSMC